jgi:hypothetical protein
MTPCGGRRIATPRPLRNAEIRHRRIYTRRPGLETRLISRITGSPSKYFSSIQLGLAVGLLDLRNHGCSLPTAAPRARARAACEAGWTLDLPRCCALRMRVSISPIGSRSFSLILNLKLLTSSTSPCRDLGQRPEFAKRDTRHLQLAVVTARTARHFAAVAHAVGAELRGSSASFSVALKRSSMGRLLSLAVIALSCGALGSVLLHQLAARCSSRLRFSWPCDFRFLFSRTAAGITCGTGS